MLGVGSHPRNVSAGGIELLAAPPTTLLPGSGAEYTDSALTLSPPAGGKWSWAIYSVAGFEGAVVPESLTSTYSGNSIWIGLADFTHNAWQWQHVGFGVEVPLDGSQNLSPAGTLHIALLSYGGEVEISSLKLQCSGLLSAAPDLAFSASDGGFADHIALNWQQPGGASFELYRDAVDGQALAATDLTALDDSAGDRSLHDYWLRATLADGSVVFAHDNGWIADTSFPGWHQYRSSARRNARAENPGPASANLLWQRDWRLQVSGEPAISADLARVCVRVLDAGSWRICCLNSLDLSTVWSYESATEPCARGVFDSDGNFYFGAADGYLRCLDSSGAEQWSYDCGGPVRNAVALGGGAIYVSTDATGLLCVETAGSLRWQATELPAGLLQEPQPAGDGSVYILNKPTDASMSSLVCHYDNAGGLDWSYGSVSDRVIAACPAPDASGVAIIESGAFDSMQGSPLRWLLADGTPQWQQDEGYVESWFNAYLSFDTDGNILAVRGAWSGGDALLHFSTAGVKTQDDTWTQYAKPGNPCVLRGGALAVQLEDGGTAGGNVRAYNSDNSLLGEVLGLPALCSGRMIEAQDNVLLIPCAPYLYRYDLVSGESAVFGFDDKLSRGAVFDDAGLAYMPIGLSLHAFDAGGSDRWSFTGSAPLAEAAAESGGMLFISDMTGTLHGVAASDGGELWSFPASGPGAPGAPALDEAGHVLYVDGTDLNCLDDAGALQWSLALDGFPMRGSGAPSILPGGTILAALTTDTAEGDAAGRFKAVSPGGEPLWTLTPDRLNAAYGADRNAACGPAGVFYLATAGGGRAQLGAAVLWDNFVYSGKRPQRPAAMAADGTCIVAVTNAPVVGQCAVYRLEMDGEAAALMSVNSSMGEFPGSPALDSEGNIYVAMADGVFYSLAADGALRWQYPLGPPGSACPAIGPDGTLLVKGADARVYCFGP